MRRGLSLVELLVVITIIALLSGLVLGVVPILRLQSRLTLTQSRMTDLLGGIARMSADGVTPGQALLERVQVDGAPALGGVRRYTTRFDGSLTVSDGAWLAYDAVRRPWELRFPWGRPAILFAQRTGVNQAKAPGLLTSVGPRSFALSQMNPRCSEAFWVAAGICPSIGAYRSDRSPRQPWNDAWGHPLVAAYALYQYGPRAPGQSPLVPARSDDPATAWDEPDRDQVAAAVGPANGMSALGVKYARQQVLAMEALRHPSIVYVAVGALGPRPVDAWADVRAASQAADASSPADREAVWVSAWEQINALSNRERIDDPSSEIWKVDEQVNAMDNPPWTGTRIGRLGDRRTVLTAPEEFP